MNPIQNTKTVNVIPPQAIKDNGSWTANAVDTKDWDYATFYFHLGATDIAMAALKLQESDDDAAADAYADVAGAVFGGSGVVDIEGAAATLPSATDANKVFVIEVDCRKVERFLKPVATAGDGATGTFLSALCVLSRGRIAPTTNAERGAGQVLRV